MRGAISDGRPYRDSWPVSCRKLSTGHLTALPLPNAAVFIPTAWVIIPTDPLRFFLPFDHHLQTITEAPIAQTFMSLCIIIQWFDDPMTQWPDDPIIQSLGISWSSVGCWQQTQLPGSRATMLHVAQK